MSDQAIIILCIGAAIIAIYLYRTIKGLQERNRLLQGKLSEMESLYYENSLSSAAAQLSDQDEANMSASNYESDKDAASEDSENSSFPFDNEGIDQQSMFKKFINAEDNEEKIRIQREYLMMCLRKLKCQPEIIEEEDLKVDFQGETFLIKCHGSIITVLDPAWISMELDSPLLNIFRTAINYTNSENIFTAFFFDDAETYNEIIISSKIAMPFNPCIPHSLELIEFIFHNAFIYKRNLLEKMEELKKEEVTNSPLLYNPGSVTKTTVN